MNKIEQIQFIWKMAKEIKFFNRTSPTATPLTAQNPIRGLQIDTINK